MADKTDIWVYADWKMLTGLLTKPAIYAGAAVMGILILGPCIREALFIDYKQIIKNLNISLF